ncbi:hypothetical protein GQ607_003131 [Colletotrichum asianum]|uniref:F-box domain-containing protein n=1 Tax=Colletotrichum asianum TaxID=702518 RepID=A0A8H3WK95_9PEZI|nr:hypothetical protein GQ607_003131 [Colletotrichum asianum]
MAPSQSGHAIVRYRRHTPSPEKGRFCTGYSTIYQAKWDENKEKCIIYRLPHEILLCVMKCLDAPSMYMARQACSLLRSFYNDFSFRYFHYVLRDKQDHIVPGAPLGFQHCVLVEHRSNIIKLLQSDEKCRRRHVSIVSETCRQPGISHRGDARQVVFRSDECWDVLGIREGEEQPTIYQRWPPMNNEWTIKVAILTEGQVVTMDLLRQGLKRIDSLLCPHTRSPQEILMKPFCRRRCVCFRESTGAVQRCYGHPRPRQRTDCCACLQVLSKDEAAVGMLMASTASHAVRCARCNIHYDWTLDEGRIILSVKGPVERFPAMLYERSLTGAYVA